MWLIWVNWPQRLINYLSTRNSLNLVELQYVEGANGRNCVCWNCMGWTGIGRNDLTPPILFCLFVCIRFCVPLRSQREASSMTNDIFPFELSTDHLLSPNAMLQWATESCTNKDELRKPRNIEYSAYLRMLKRKKPEESWIFETLIFLSHHGWCWFDFIFYQNANSSKIWKNGRWKNPQKLSAAKNFVP